MTRYVQHIRERNFASLLIESHFPASVLDNERLAPPAPDLCLRTPDGIIGLEVTEINLTDRSREASEHDTTKLIRHYARELGVPPMLLSVRFHHEADLRRNHRDKLAKSIALLLLEVINNDNFASEWNYEDIPRDLCASVIGLHALRSGSDWDKNTVKTMTGFVDHDFQIFQHAIDKKQEKLPGYRKQFPVCYLLLVATWDSASSFAEWTPALDEHVFTSSFDRVFFLDVSSKAISELKTHMP